MADNLRILLSAQLNIGKSIGDINTAISGLEKKVNSLKLKIEVPQDFQKSIQSFITATEKMKKISDDQNKVMQESQDVYKKLDGTITTVTQKVLANGEVIQKTKTIHDANRKAMQDETIAAQKLADAVDKQNKSDLDSITILRNKANAITGFNVKSSKGYTVTSANYESDGQTLKSARVTTNYKKQREDELAVARQANKELERVAQEEYNIRKAIAKREEDFLKQKANLENKVLDAQRRYKGDTNAGALGGLLTSVQGATSSGAISKLETDLKRLTSTMSTARSNSISFGEAMQTALTRIVQWGVSTTLIYGSLRQFKEGIAYINELDNALNQIRIVTGKSQEDVKKLATEYNNLGKQMSVSTKDIASTGASLFRQGLNEDQVKDRMDAVIKYAKISGLSLQESDKIITASVNGTKASTSELIDIFSFLGDTTSAGADEIGRAFQKTASLAAVAGLDYKKLASYIATVSSVTRESAETIGNSFKSLLSRYQSIKEKGFNEEDATNINQVTRALKDVGDQTGTTLDAIDKSTGQLRNYGDVLDDLAKVWDKLNPKQKEYLQTTLGGTYQADKFAALMNNYKDSIKSYTGSLDAAGVANQKFQIWQDSSAAKIERFKSSWEGFWQNSIDSSTIKTFISLATGLVSSLDNIGNVVLLVSGLFLTFKSQAIAGLVTGAASSVQALFATRTALQSTAQAAEASTVAVNGTAVAMTGLQRALGIIGLVLTAGSLLYSVFNQVDDATQSLNKTIDENNKKYSDNASAINNALSYYKQNYDAISSNAEVKNELFQIQNQLIDTYGKEASGLDLVNGKYSEQIAKIKDLNKANLDNKIKDKQINVNTINEKQYSNPTIGYNPTLKHEIGFDSNKSYDVGGDIGSGSLKFEGYYEKLLDLQDQIRNKNVAIFDSQELIPKSAQEWSNVLSSVQTKITDLKPLYDQIISLENDKKEKIKSSTLEQNNFNGEQIKFFESLDGVLKKQPTKEYESSIKNVAATIKGFDGKNMVDAVEKIKQLPEIKSNNNLMKGLDELSNSLKGSSNQTVDFGAKIKELDSNIDNTDKSISSLASAYQRLNEGEQLSTSEILKLAREHPQLLSYLNTHNGLIQDKGQILQQVAEIERKTQLAEAENLRNSVTNTFNALESKRKMYAEYYAKMAPMATEVNPFLGMDGFTTKFGGKLTPEEEQKFKDLKKQKDELDLTVSLLSKPIDLASYGKKPDKPNSEPSAFDDSQKYQIDEYKQALRDLDGQTKESESVMTRYKDASAEYRVELEKQVGLTKEKQKLTAEEGIRLRGDISKLENDIASTGDQKKKNALLQQLDQAKNNLAELSKSWWDYALSAEQANKKVSESLQKEVDGRYNFSKDWIEDQKKLNKLSLDDELAAWKRVVQNHKDDENDLAVIREENAQKRIDAEKEVARVQDELTKQYKAEFDKIMDDTSKAIDKTIDDLKKKLSADSSDNEILNTSDLSNSVDAIMSKLNEVDNLYPNGLQVIDTSSDARSKLDYYKNTIIGLSSAIQAMSKESYDNADQTQESIDKQIAFSQLMKTIISSIKQNIASMTTMYQQQEASISNQIKLHQQQYDLIVENLKKQLEIQDTFNLDEFSDSIASIIFDLNSLDGIHTEGSFIESTLGTREELDTFKQKILDIAKAVSDYQNATSSPTQGSIQNEITFVNGLKTKIDALNNTLRDTELQYKNEEKALENLITTQTKYYDDQIAAQQEVLKNLDDQIEAEDRLKKLQDINDEINKTKADKRFSYIGADGIETLTFDKGKVGELEKQRDELLQQYQRDDLKKAIQNNIDNLEKSKQDTIKTLQDQLDKTKEIHQIELDSQRLYIQNLENLYQIAVNDVNSKIEKLKSSYDTEITNEQERLNQLQAVHQQELDSMNMYVGYLSSLDSALITNTQTKIDTLKIQLETERQNMIDHWIDLNDITKTGSKKFSELVDEWNKSATSKLDSMVAGASARLAQMQAIMAAMAAMSGSSGISTSGVGASSGVAIGVGLASIGKYHTGTDSVGMPALGKNETPAILELGEAVYTKIQQLNLADIIVKPLDYLSGLISNVKLPTFTPTAKTATASSPVYNLSNFTINANNPTELFAGIQNLVKSHKT